MTCKHCGKPISRDSNGLWRHLESHAMGCAIRFAEPPEDELALAKLAKEMATIISEFNDVYNEPGGVLNHTYFALHFSELGKRAKEFGL